MRHHPEPPHVRRDLNSLVLESIPDKNFYRVSERFSLRDEPVRPFTHFNALTNQIPSLRGGITPTCLARKFEQTLRFFKSHLRLTAQRSRFMEPVLQAVYALSYTSQRRDMC